MDGLGGFPAPSSKYWVVEFEGCRYIKIQPNYPSFGQKRIAMTTQAQPERSESFQPGQSFGKFYLVQLIGEGGTSRIFKALQQPISRVVALKIPSFSKENGLLTPDEFLSEATLMARLDHGNIVRIHDFGVEEGKAFICMEHVDGWNLLELADRGHPLSTSAVLSIGLQTLEALLHAHSRDVLHQDLSPANVLVSRNGTAKLIDFGMAGKRPLTQGRGVVGTPAFLSPEHVAGLPSTARSDLFSFGSLLYFMAAGEPLFDTGAGSARMREAFQEIEKARWQPPVDRLRRLPPSLSQLVRTALEGGDGADMHRDLKALWAQAEGQGRPEEVLRRELAEGADAAPGADPVSEKEIREGYLRLRSEGRHREAMALLERALRKQPDNPVLRDLLSTPPVRPKSTPVTMEVESPPERRPSGVPAPSGGIRKRAAWAGAAGVLALAVLSATAAFRGRGTGAEDAEGSQAAEKSALTRVSATLPPSSPPGPSLASMTAPAANPVPEPSRAAGKRPMAGPRAARPPALSLSGPQGTRVLVNDTLELTAPAPKGGWTLPTGLVNLVVSRPDEARPISSSLFAAADTLYMLNLEADGGFTVSRRRRR